MAFSAECSLAPSLPMNRVSGAQARLQDGWLGAGRPEVSLRVESAMDGRREPTTPARVIGYAEMQALALSVVGSLERAGLADMLPELKRRLLDRRPEDICGSIEAGPAAFHLSYKPMVELALYEVREV